MKIVAFMQNMWVREPQRIHDQLARVKPSQREKLRSMLIHYCLFAGCLTGRRLKAAFGDELCEEIIWDEASPVICDNARHIPPADAVHILEVLKRHEPDIVIAFGKSARAALKELWQGHLICSPHPACRRIEDLLYLHQAARELHSLLKNPPSTAHRWI